MLMKAIRYHGPNQPFRLEEISVPEPGPGEVRIKIQAAGMCHTELHFASGLLNLGVAPLTMGHEISGVIESVGDNVNKARIGERVLVYYYAGCGTCEWCRKGEENLCSHLRHEYGFFNDGGYAEYIVVPARNAVTLPEDISTEEAAPIGCGVTTAIHALNLANIKPNDTIVVYGVGAVAFGLIQIGKLRGANVVGISRTPEKLELASELGADHTINANEVESTANVIREITNGRGADVVFELVAVKETIEQSKQMLTKRGRLVFVGYSEDQFNIHPIELVINEVSVMGSVGNTLEELQEAVRLVAQNKVRTIVAQVLPLDRWAEGLEALQQGNVKGRVVLKP